MSKPFYPTEPKPDHDVEMEKVKRDVDLIGYGFLLDGRRVPLSRLTWFNRPGELALPARPLSFDERRAFELWRDVPKGHDADLRLGMVLSPDENAAAWAGWQGRAYLESQVTPNGTLAESGALRQLKHNDGSDGFVMAYDKDAADQYVAQAAIERDVLLKALSDVLSVIDEVGVATGICCCGDDMLAHSNPMTCSHSAVDAGEYYFTDVVEAARVVRDRASAP